MGKHFLFALLGLLFLCSYVSAQVPPPERYGYVFVRTFPMNPLPWYQNAYNTMRECAGSTASRHSEYEMVEWAVADAMIEIDSVLGIARTLGGAWLPPHRVVLDEDYVYDWGVVAHELLHEILGVEYNHEDPEFIRCDPLAQEET